MRGLAVIGVTLLLTGCAGVSVVPPDLKDKVDEQVSFLQVKASPLSYKGRLIVAGGMVLTAKPLKQDGTRIEILELPLDGDYEPTGRLTDSQGRFLAFHKEFLDPATIPMGTRMTVVGEVTGSVSLPVDEVDYVYLTLDIKAVTVWPPKVPVWWGRIYPYFGAYWGPYWGPYWGQPLWIPLQEGKR
ncbi:MAG: Slp family lipoprotein [Nitrospirae bacterium]|nr:Slp family lipoprotein [Nitrospirota bacterium]